jgi:hypothetical protein
MRINLSLWFKCGNAFIFLNFHCMTLLIHLSTIISAYLQLRCLKANIVVCPFVFFLLAIVLSVLRYTDSDYPFVSSNSSLIHPINRFNPRHMLFLFHASTWISNAICRDLFVWGERWLLLLFIFVVLLTISSKPTIIRTINIVALSDLYNCLTCCL